MISAIVPTRGGDARLARNLASVVQALEASGEAWELLVVDDGRELAQAPPQARVLALEPPRGYGPAVNAGARAAAGERLLVLNDDVRLEASAVRTLREALPSDGVFAVAPRIVSPLARCGDEGGKTAVVRAGLVEIAEAPSETTHPTLYPVGCCYLCPRHLFLELGGYDDAYAPYFFEDVDLGYRAWRRGLASLHVPAAVCHHEGSATIGERSMDERLRAWQRNGALFQLLNLQDARLRAASLGAFAAIALLDERRPVRAGLLAALECYRDAARGPASGLADREILERVRRP